MSVQHYNTFITTGMLPPTGETFISPSREYSSKYKGVLVEFQAQKGTTAALLTVGVRAPGTQLPLPLAKRGWATRNALFKKEGAVINIGLGKGRALLIFNANIRGYKALSYRR